jgi:glucose/arabinose dehydrogenase
VPRPITIAALVVVLPLALGAGLAGGDWASHLGHSEVERSREAAERRCERAYVTPAVRRLDDGATGIAPLRLDDVDVAGAPLAQPSTIAFPAGGGPGVLGEREGLVRAFDGRTVGEPLLDFTGDTFTRGDGGLLSSTYSPDGDWLYLYRTRADGTDVVAAYPLIGGRPDGTRETVVIEIDHPPSEQHHGGGLAFGPDGFLYVATGDGGGFGDPAGNAQRLDVLLGKILRLDPDPAGGPGYRVPPDNPFAGPDTGDARPEIYAYGLRNPYRIWFDAPTGDLWIADVGQGCWEEIDWVPGGSGGGENFEWDRREGTHRFQGGHVAGGVEPVLTFPHSDGRCAVIGGFTYHGSALPELDGFYLFTDLCDGRLNGVRYRPGQPPDVVDLGVGADEPVAVLPGPDGEPYVLSIDGGARRVTVGSG